jgi:RND family efflux transporter MFP subunit
VRREAHRRRRAGAALLALGALGCGGGDREREAAPPPPAREVVTAPVEEVRWERAVPVLGSLEPMERIVLAAKVAGRLTSVSVDLGTAVRAGQEVARIDPTDFELRLKRAEAAVEQARARLGVRGDQPDDAVTVENASNVKLARAQLDEATLGFDRAVSLHKQGIASQADYDTAEAARKVAQSRLDDAIEEHWNRRALLAQRRTELAIARQELDDTTLRAPWDGAIEERLAGPGQMLATDDPVARLVRVDVVRVRGEVPERAAAEIRSGQETRVVVEGETAPREARIVRIAPALREPARVLVVEAELRNDGALRPGAFARIEIVVAPDARALAIPASALRSFAGVDKVLVVDQGAARERRVTTGRRREDRVEILDGLHAGDRVVVAPADLRAGETVRAAE